MAAQSSPRRGARCPAPLPRSTPTESEPTTSRQPTLANAEGREPRVSDGCFGDQFARERSLRVQRVAPARQRAAARRGGRTCGGSGLGALCPCAIDAMARSLPTVECRAGPPGALDRRPGAAQASTPGAGAGTRPTRHHARHYTKNMVWRTHVGRNGVGCPRRSTVHCTVRSGLERARPYRRPPRSFSQSRRGSLRRRRGPSVQATKVFLWAPRSCSRGVPGTRPSLELLVQTQRTIPHASTALPLVGDDAGYHSTCTPRPDSVVRLTATVHPHGSSSSKYASNESMLFAAPSSRKSTSKRMTPSGSLSSGQIVPTALSSREHDTPKPGSGRVQK